MAEELETLTARAMAPAFWAELQADHKAGMANLFILHGNTSDYVEHPLTNLTLREYLEQRLLRSHTVISYAPDQGITFPGPELIARESRARFDRCLGIEPAAPAHNGTAAFNPFAALGAAGGGSFGASEEQPLPSDAPSAMDLLIKVARVASTRDADCPVRAVGSAANRREIGAHVAIIIERTDLVCPPEDKARLAPADRAMLSLLHRSGTDVEINRQENLVILLAPSLEEVHADLRLASSGIRTIEIGVPDLDQRLSFIARTLTAHDIELDGLTEVTLANQTAGLNRRHVEDIALRAAQAGGRLTMPMVKARKTELIKSEYAGILEVLDPDVTLDMVGGHELALDYLKTWVVGIVQSGDPKKLARLTKGIMLAGPSGTGKTFLARALANAIGWNIVQWKADKLKDKWVGSSQQNLAKAMRGTEAMAPCLVFLDEVDQSVRRSEGGDSSGTEGDMFGAILEWLGEDSHKGQIIAVAATNRPDNLDAAFLRPGRFDVKIPLLVAQNDGERRDMLTRLVRRFGPPVEQMDVLAVGTVLDTLASQTEGWTAAELQNLVEKAARTTEVLDTPFHEALARARQSLKAATRNVDQMTRLALSICDDLDLVPERWQPYVAEPMPTVKAARTAPGTARRAIAQADDLFDDDEEV